MSTADHFGPGHIGNCPRDAQHPGIAARGEAHRFGGLQQQRAARFVRGGVGIEQVAVQFGIGAPPGAFEPPVLHPARRCDPRRNLGRTFGRGGQCQVADTDRVNLDMEVDPVEQRA